MALLAAGTPAPTFKGTNLTGPEVNLENYKGKKAVVLLFSPDRVDPAQIGAVRSLWMKNKEKVEIITVSRKIPQDSIAMTKAALQSLGAKFPAVYDRQMAVFALYGVENPAAIYIIDPEGNIVFSQQAETGKVDPKILEEAIATYVK